MACLICGRSSDYDLVRDGETEAEVCKSCTEEFLAVDEGNPTCVYCDRNGVYDVRTPEEGGFPGAETTGDTFSTPYESVLCEEHFAQLGDEEPAGSPEAADEADVEGESAAEGGDGADGDAEGEADAGGEGEADGDAESAEADAEADEAQNADADESETTATDGDADDDGDADSDSDAADDN